MGVRESRLVPFGCQWLCLGPVDIWGCFLGDFWGLTRIVSHPALPHWPEVEMIHREAALGQADSRT